MSHKKPRHRHTKKCVKQEPELTSACTVTAQVQTSTEDEALEDFGIRNRLWALYRWFGMLLITLALLLVVFANVSPSNALILQIIAIGAASYVYASAAKRRIRHRNKGSVNKDSAFGYALFGLLTVIGIIEHAPMAIGLGLISIILTALIRTEKLVFDPDAISIKSLR